MPLHVRRDPASLTWPLALLLATALLFAGPAPEAATAPSRVAYQWPVSGPVVRAFDPPGVPWGSGHRGVDLVVEADQVVRPMAAGVVRWSGIIAGARWVTVQHADGIMTSYGPLAGEVVPTGRQLGPDDPVGTARGDAHGRDGHLHVGARRDGRYIDPASLIAGTTPMVATLVGPGTASAGEVTDPTHPITLVPGVPPSPNHLVVLAGLSSDWGRDDPFDLEALGYGPDDAERFSYRGVDEDGNPRPYTYEDTWGQVHGMAEALRDQLRAFAAANPGQAIDLAGHSLGGLVAMYYLLVLHDPTDPSLPPIGKVVTVASPLQGADSAAAATIAREGAVGRLLLELAQAHLMPELSPDMPVLDDLHPDSQVTRALAQAWERYRTDPFSSPLALGTDVLTIGGVVDPVVNEHRSGLAGADHERIGDPDLVRAHSDVTRDPRTVELLRAFLAGEPLPSGGLGDLLVDLVAPVASGAVASLEYLLALGVRAIPVPGW